MSLETIGGYFVLENNTMNRTYFASLRTVSGGVRIMNNTGLGSVVTEAETGTGGFPVLHTVVDDVVISGEFSKYVYFQLDLGLWR